MVQAQPKKDWREKYLDLVDIQESLQQQYSTQLEQMRRALVRVSLAADGVDPELDSVLASLREHLKTPDKQHSLHKRLAVVEEAIISFDERRGQRLLNLYEKFTELLDPVLDLDLSRQVNKSCRTLKKSLKQRLEHQQELPAIIAELAELQSAVLEHVQVDRPSLLQKLGLSSQATNSNPSLNEESESIENSVDLDEFINNFGEEESKELATNNTQVAELGIVIRDIVDLIDPNSTENKTVETIRELLEQELNPETIKTVLEQLRDVVRQTVVGTKTEFSEFLQKTNHELNGIARILNNVAQVANDQNDKRAKLRANMQNHIHTLQVNVNEAVELEQLKQQVNSQLENIRSSISEYDKPSNTLSEQLKSLLDQVERFEQDAIKTAKHLSEQREKAQHDNLTGLYNREAYEERIKLETARWKRYENSLTIAVLDVDYFKKINDTYGHQAGDKVLRLIAQSLKKRLRDVDFIARFGGEEFVVLLPETNAKNAKVVMEKLRTAIAETPFHFRKQRVQITLSVGLSEFAEGDTAPTAFARADKALYQSKNNGRNKTTVL